MKCDVIDHHCQPIAAAATVVSGTDTHRLDSVASFANRLFWHRFLRARMFEQAMRELARRELS